MKKIMFVLLFGHTVQVNSQTYVTIPDTGFAAYLRATVPTAMSGNQLDTSSTLVTTSTHTLILGGHNFANLFGLQYFSSLTYLDCSINPNPCPGCLSNSFTTLPKLSNTLLYLNCSGNYGYLTSLPALPNSLQFLDCSFDGHLTSLPTLPNSLTTLNCASCDISCFPTFPNSITSFNIQYNPFNCLPNYITDMNAATLAYPLCAAGNTHGCPVAVAGIEQYASNNEQVNIYPNPNNGSFFVEPSGEAKQAMQVYDVNGKVVLSQSISGKTTIDASGLNEGVYNISIISNEGIVNKKLVLVK